MTDAEAKASVLLSPDGNSQFIGKDSDSENDWRQKERVAAKDIITQWTCVWANSGWYWRIEKSGMLLSIGSQWLGHDLVTEKQWQIL